MRDLIPAVEFLALALADEAPALARRIALGLALCATIAALYLVG